MIRTPRGDAPALVSVLVVDDSPVQRRFLRGVLSAAEGFDIVGEARTGREAVALVERLSPATVLMDLDLPVMNGIDAIERIMATRPTPIVVCSGYVDGPSANADAATAAGAVDVIAKPSAESGIGLDAYAEQLRRRLRVAARVRVITHPRGRLRQPAARPVARGLARPASPAPASSGAVGPLEPVDGEVQLVAIGASTGGPQALAQLLAALPGDLAPAVLVVQHMAEGFIEGLADWLDGLCALPVGVGASGRRLHPGTVTVAPSGRNLIVHDRLRVTLEEPPASQFHVPGIDASFGSVADSVGAAAIGVLLTGMGRDGAQGMCALQRRGAVTIGQDEATSAVWGMPGAARALGAVTHELPLPAIAPALLALLGRLDAVPEEARALLASALRPPPEAAEEGRHRSHRSATDDDLPTPAAATVAP